MVSKEDRERMERRNRARQEESPLILAAHWDLWQPHDLLSTSSPTKARAGGIVLQIGQACRHPFREVGTTYRWAAEELEPL